jgi:hypothetical protein
VCEGQGERLVKPSKVLNGDHVKGNLEITVNFCNDKFWVGRRLHRGICIVGDRAYASFVDNFQIWRAASKGSSFTGRNQLRPNESLTEDKR